MNIAVQKSKIPFLCLRLNLVILPFTSKIVRVMSLPLGMERLHPKV